MYRDRAGMEREHAAKLQILFKRAAEKKSKLEAALALGEHPTKAFDSSTPMQNSLIAAYTELMDSLANTAHDHVSIADGLTSQVVEVLKAIEKKNEEAKKTEMQFFQKLLSDRDRVYSERLKCKQKARAQDDKHADRTAKQTEQQRNEMLNSKNAYLISIAVANNVKAQFYNTSLPTLEDVPIPYAFASLKSRRLVERFAKILQHSQALQISHLDSLKNRINRVNAAFGAVDAAKDQNLFIDHNIRPFTAPDDWSFEPCPTHYDTNDISVEPAPKIFLQNKLTRCQMKLSELGPLVDAKQQEQDQLLSQIGSYKLDHTFGTIDSLSDNLLDVQHQLDLYTSSERILETEIDTICSAIGDEHGDQRPHSFKATSFSIPTQCGYCKSTIWGLSSKGKTCKLCGISVHSKCELKIPADCQQGSLVRTESLARRGSTASRRSTSSRVVSSPPQTHTPLSSSYVSSIASSDSTEESHPTARVLFDFKPTSEFELEVSGDQTLLVAQAQGQTVDVIEADDGSGWVKVADMQGKDGLVPASYLQHGDGRPPATQSSSGHRVRALYAYEAQGPDEISLVEGQTIELTPGPSGGQNYGDGWWEGIDSAGRRGIFPSNYVSLE
ncbi:hypothetical protein H0H92_013157 [Tricholoma furcatifolium]|nr:hypothetical protein H0H92_013157 [Tricholoma furcatifolium]